MSFDLPNLAKWRGRQWAAALGLVLLVTVSPLVWIEWRQYNLLEDLAIKQVDSLMWQAYQLEREAGRLREALQNAPAASPATDPWALTERYEIFLSRIDLLTNIPRHDLLAGAPDYTKTLEQVRAFSQFADPVFANPQQVLDNAPLRSELVTQLAALDTPLSELTREANRAVARFVDERNQQLRQQGLLVLSLAAIQIAVMLLFVGLLVRHIRRQQRQYAELQILSEALKTARDQAEAANRGKSVFLANMSHEIRTPFQGLLGMLNLLDDASLTGQQRDYLQTARDSAMHLLGVLNDILDVSTMESGTMKLSPVPVHLPSVMQEVDGLMQVAARDKGLTLNMYAAADLPQWVSADPTRLRQIMFNLINNAIKFTEQGSVIAELALNPSEQNGVLFTVRDTGMGMDAQTRDKLFTRFYQADNSLRRRVGGTGLGLEISRNLARMMGGDIQVASTPGEGSVFTVALTLPPANPPPAASTLGTDLGFTRKLQILVAEDHPINLKYMSILLEKMGHEATFCENGQEALALLQRQPFDLVLLDYHMPVLDGLATTEAIRALDGPQSEVKIILVTADVVNDTRKRAREVGVSEFASKPLQIEELTSAIERCGLLDFAAQSGEVIELSNPFPFSSYESPVRLPDAEQPINALIDGESFEEILDMMPVDSLNELLKTIFDAPDGTAHVLSESIAKGNRADIGYHAHKLKGAAMLMGFRAMVATACQIEYLAMQTNHPIGRELAQQVLREAALTKKAVERFNATEAH